MNWRQVLNRLPLNIVKNLNQEATREAQKDFDTYAFRCYYCEKYLHEEAPDQLSACRQAQIKGWRGINTSEHPNFIQLIWVCPPCIEWRK